MDSYIGRGHKEECNGCINVCPIDGGCNAVWCSPNYVRKENTLSKIVSELDEKVYGFLKHIGCIE